jgi:CO/xanthine dehydrogenase FAD-binding subunit
MVGSETRVFRPKSLGGLLRLYARNPDALLYAGGTEIIPHHRKGSGGILALPEKVIFLGAVPDLARLSRTQRFLDIGACLSVSRVLSMGRNVLPPVLFVALSGIGTPSIRNLVTLGGNLCASHSRGDIRSALSVLDAQVELRSVAGARWIGVGQLFSVDKGLDLTPGELLTRVRVPLEDWDVQVFRKVPLDGPGSHGSLCFAAVAHFPKGSLDTMRLCFTAPVLPLFRSRELESRLKSARLPVSPKQVDALLAELKASLGTLPGADRQGSYVAKTALRLARAFLAGLNARSLKGP